MNNWGLDLRCLDVGGVRFRIAPGRSLKPTCPRLNRSAVRSYNLTAEGEFLIGSQLGSLAINKEDDDEGDVPIVLHSRARDLIVSRELIACSDQFIVSLAINNRGDEGEAPNQSVSLAAAASFWPLHSSERSDRLKVTPFSSLSAQIRETIKKI